MRYNQVKVFVGIDWQCPGAGIIESVTPDVGESGAVLSTGTAVLKLEEGQFGAIDVDDITMGIYHFGNSQDATADKDDSKGNFAFAGFATAYWRITSVDAAHKTFRYALRPGYSVHPQSQMTFACYGNFTKPERQTSTYRTRTYTRRLWKQNNWVIEKDNIAAQDGDLSNLSVHGLQLQGYSTYLDSIYFTGTIQQLKKPDGTTIQLVNERGKWVKDTKYDFYDRVSHNGSLWLCVNEKGTNTEPNPANPDWLQQVDKGSDGSDIFTYGEWREGLHVKKNGIVTMDGKAFIAKVDTDNPPMWVYTDDEGSRYTLADGGYVLTSEYNTEEYMMLVESGMDGPQGVPGKDGEDGKIFYTWIRYADDAQGNGISNDPTGKDYIGFAYNKEIQQESNNPSDYTWSRYKGEQGLPGLDGLQGEKGEQGIPGTPGKDGRTTYFHVKYSPNANGVPMQETPAAYIGTYVDFTEEDSSDPEMYDWAKFEGIDGKDGANGLPGKNGVDGKTSYLHIAYATSADGSQGFDVSESAGKSYIGQYVDFTEADSADYRKYKWSLIKGTDGIPGKPGADGKTFYTWVAYSDNADGNPMYQVPHDGTKYIGIAVNKETREESTNPADYTWSLFKGADGESITNFGPWKSGVTVPKMAVVSMGGNSFLSKKATTNPPMWIF
ncbi:host specificity protein, partial [gut metagenome]